MRATALLITLMMSVLAFAASADAAPEEPRCNREDVVHNTALRVTLKESCRYEVAVMEDIICVGSWGGVVERDHDGHTVKVYYCDGGIPDRIAGDIALSTAGPCKDDTKYYGVATVETKSDCFTQVDIKLQDCIHMCSYKTVVDTPVLKVRNYGQDTGSNSASICKESVEYHPGMTVYSHADCSKQIDIKTYDCVWNCGYVTVIDTPVLVVRNYQDLGGENMARPNCPGIWYEQGSQQVGGLVVSYGTNLKPECTYVTVGRA